MKRKSAPKPRDIKLAKRKIEHMVATYGSTRYKKHRHKCARVVKKILKRYNIQGKLNEAYWELAFTCWMIGAP